MNPELIWVGKYLFYFFLAQLAILWLLLPLAATSNNWSIRRMGPMGWKRLHQLSYAAAILGSVHYVMLVKGWQIEPLLYLGAILLLLIARLPGVRRRATA